MGCAVCLTLQTCLQATWERAEDLCVVWGGHLASVHSAQENAFCQSLITGPWSLVREGVGGCEVAIFGLGGNWVGLEGLMGGDLCLSAFIC